MPPAVVGPKELSGAVSGGASRTVLIRVKVAERKSGRAIVMRLLVNI